MGCKLRRAPTLKRQHFFQRWGGLAHDWEDADRFAMVMAPGIEPVGDFTLRFHIECLISVAWDLNLKFCLVEKCKEKTNEKQGENQLFVTTPK